MRDAMTAKLGCFHCRVVWICTAIVAGVLFAASNACADVQLSAYGGHADTSDADVELLGRESTDLRFEDVSWAAESFTSPIYYGLRLTYWFDRAPQWGLGVDFTHAKMIASPNQIVGVQGTRDGVDVAARERLDDTFGKLALSHGHNLLTLNAFYRSALTDRIAPYAGLGVGAAIPHVETNVAGVETEAYQVAGPAVQELIGLSGAISERLSVFAEYKLGYADVEANLDGGEILQTQPWTHHFIFGLSLRLL